ncbi:hypothetical protein H0H81_004491 [Sphagnurus paluster]|uniref:Uncharacterized protein n=1 Tax=Sphagnurus paluster TaxID=117069 RepID=A0A9P7FS63_9AGAR|nr:hypothetical protein H0H81_004491 [Sphagnurus paluster]
MPHHGPTRLPPALRQLGASHANRQDRNPLVQQLSLRTVPNIYWHPPGLASTPALFYPQFSNKEIVQAKLSFVDNSMIYAAGSNLHSTGTHAGHMFEQNEACHYVNPHSKRPADFEYLLIPILLPPKEGALPHEPRTISYLMPLTTFWWLGFWFDRHLTFATHIEKSIMCDDTPALRLVAGTPIFALYSTSPTHEGTKAATRPDSDRPAGTRADNTDAVRETEAKPDGTVIVRCRRGSTQESRPSRDTGR